MRLPITIAAILAVAFFLGGCWHVSITPPPPADDSDTPNQSTTTVDTTVDNKGTQYPPETSIEGKTALRYTTEGKKVYNNPELGLYFEYPKSWEVDRSSLTDFTDFTDTSEWPDSLVRASGRSLRFDVEDVASQKTILYITLTTNDYTRPITNEFNYPEFVSGTVNLAASKDEVVRQLIVNGVKVVKYIDTISDGHLVYIVASDGSDYLAPILLYTKQNNTKDLANLNYSVRLNTHLGYDLVRNYKIDSTSFSEDINNYISSSAYSDLLEVLKSVRY